MEKQLDEASAIDTALANASPISRGTVEVESKEDTGDKGNEDYHMGPWNLATSNPEDKAKARNFGLILWPRLIPRVREIIVKAKERMGNHLGKISKRSTWFLITMMIFIRNSCSKTPLRCSGPLVSSR